MTSPDLPLNVPALRLKALLHALITWAGSAHAIPNLEAIFGTNLDKSTAARHLTAFSRGDFSTLPPVTVLPAEDMPGLWGGYSRELMRIFVSEACPADRLSEVLLEEIGHFLDQELCAEETPGEEGARFASTVLGLAGDAHDEDDALADLCFMGKRLLVEAARQKKKKNGSGSEKKSSKRRNSGNSQSLGAARKLRGSLGSDSGSGGRYSRKNPPRDDSWTTQVDPSEVLKGTFGDDAFRVSHTNVEFIDPAGTDSVLSSVSFDLGKHSLIENLQLTGSGNTSGTGNYKANVLIGNGGSNSLNGAGESDTIFGEGGNDYLDGGEDAAADTLVGGTGDDTYVLRDTLDQIVEGAGEGSDTIATTLNNVSLAELGITNVENLAYIGTGSSGVTFSGNQEKNQIYGSDGADSLDGREGLDSMFGGKGNDTYVVDQNDDAVFEDSGEGTDTVISTASAYVLAGNVENLKLGGAESISGVGNNRDNVLAGNAGANILDGLSGNDILAGDGLVSLEDSSGEDINVKVYAASDTGANALALAQKALADSSGISITQAKLTGAEEAAGLLEEQTSLGVVRGEKIEIGAGFVLSTGLADSSSSTSDLLSISNNTSGSYLINDVLKDVFNPTVVSRDAVTLEFNFTVSDPSASWITMDVLFASEEYPDFTASFPDIAAVFIDGVNWAYFNGDSSKPLSALQTNVDAGYFIDNSNLEYSTKYNGITRSLVLGGQLGTAVNGEHSIKIVIGDTNDRAYDTSIFVSNIKAVETATSGLNLLTPFGDDLLRGGSGNDTLLGNGGDDILRGEDDNDWLDGGAGADYMVGGAGDDVYLLDNSGDEIIEVIGEGDNDKAIFSISYSLTAGCSVELLELSGDANLTLSGNDLSNTLTGNAGANTLRGMGGDDSLVGGAGVDTLIGGSGNDDYLFDGADLILENGDEGMDTVRSAFSYTLANNVEYLVLTGADTISGFGNLLTNTIEGNTGANSLDGGAGADSLVGGAGSDTYFVDNAGDVVVEVSGGGDADLVISAVGRTLDANVENFTYTGANNATLVGNDLDNAIDVSTGGINNLSGGDGNDTLLVNGSRIGVVDGGNGTDWLRLTGDLLAFRNPSFTSIEVLDLSLLADSASVTLDGAASGLGTLISTSYNDTIEATAFTSAITIDASASSGARLIGSTANANTNTLIGGAAGGNEFVLGAVSTNSLVGGSNGLDTLTLLNGGDLDDSQFETVSYIGTLKVEGATNRVTLGANALLAGVRTLVGGEGNDVGAGNTFNSSAYGPTGVLFQITDQNYLSNITTMVGGVGVDTLKFSRDGVSVTRENVAKIKDVDIIQSANGNNLFLFDNNFLVAGVETIIGGTGRDTIDMASNFLYTPTSGADIIAVDMSAGEGYTLVSTTRNFAYAQVIGSSTNKGAVILDGVTVWDEDFANMRLGNIGALTMRTQSSFVTLGENAVASGLNKLNLLGGNNTADVTNFAGTLTISGGSGIDLVHTSFAALSSLNFLGGADDDVLRLVDAEARSITSLSGDFDALELDGGNNFVVLGNDAGLSTIAGGRGYDTISMLNNTTGIHFVMDANRLGDTASFSSLDGGSGMDTLTVHSVGGEFLDTKFARVGSVRWVGDVGSIENFVTEAGASVSYTFGQYAYGAGIRNIYAVDGLVLDAADFNDGDPTTNNDRTLNFVFDTAENAALADITGSGSSGYDTLTLTTNSQTVDTATFLNLTSVEMIVLANGANDITLESQANNWGLRAVVGGSGNDRFNTSSMAYTLNASLVGGAGNDSILAGSGNDTLIGTNSTALGDEERDTFTGGAGGDRFVLGDANNAYYNTDLRNGDFAIITDFGSGSDIIQLKDLSLIINNDIARYGYLLSSDDVYEVGNFGSGINSYLYADSDNSGTINFGDNLIAAINNTAAGGGALSTSDLTNTSRFSIV